MRDIGSQSKKPSMEDDRAQIDFGKAVDTEMDLEIREKQKQPKKRFIGRKAAAEIAGRRSRSTRTIEDSNAVQSMSFSTCSSKNSSQ